MRLTKSTSKFEDHFVSPQNAPSVTGIEFDRLLRCQRIYYFIENILPIPHVCCIRIKVSKSFILPRCRIGGSSKVVITQKTGEDESNEFSIEQDVDCESMLTWFLTNHFWKRLYHGQMRILLEEWCGARILSERCSLCQPNVVVHLFILRRDVSVVTGWAPDVLRDLCHENALLTTM